MKRVKRAITGIVNLLVAFWVLLVTLLVFPDIPQTGAGPALFLLGGLLLSGVVLKNGLNGPNADKLKDLDK